MKSKVETSVHLQYFCTFVETQFDRKVKVIRSDNGKEFEIKRFYVEKGILHEISCIETPGQNERIKRKYQHNFNTANIEILK